MKTIAELLAKFRALRTTEGTPFPVSLQMAYVAGCIDMAFEWGEWGDDFDRQRAMKFGTEAVAIVGVLADSEPTPVDVAFAAASMPRRAVPQTPDARA